MIIQWKMLAWTGAIILPAIAMNASGMNESASVIIIPGISGAAWGSLEADFPCSGWGIRGCLQ